jgi:hypothetical protein
MTEDIDLHTAQLRSHRGNIERYCRLLATELTELEREYLHALGKEAAKARSRARGRAPAGNPRIAEFG